MFINIKFAYGVEMKKLDKYLNKESIFNASLAFVTVSRTGDYFISFVSIEHQNH